MSPEKKRSSKSEGSGPKSSGQRKASSSGSTGGSKKSGGSKRASASKKSTQGGAPKKSTPQKKVSSAREEPAQAQEHELAEGFLEDVDPDMEASQPPEEPDQDHEPIVDEDGDRELDEEEAELERLISADTQEWESVDAEEAAADDGEEETLVGAAGAKLAREKARSGLGTVSGSGAGRKVTSGLGAPRRWRPGFPLWARFMSASFLIIVSIATATATSLILYLGGIADDLRDSVALAGVDKFLTEVDGGSAQTILILGSDKDPERKLFEKGFKGLSDTTMLLRLDPDRNAIALFSLPRDLRVEIPGYGTDKLNAAYGFGGPQLTLRTVESLLSTPSQPFEVNHLVNVDFEGFARAVNAIDCVYVDVDRRYFHSNDNTPAAADYEEIDLQPGYQALCGFDALDYARYRHTDNDIVRAARQQEFLREARSKVPPDRLISDRKKLISIFTEHTSSDINDPQTMLQVLKLFLEARDAPLKEVHFEGTIGPSFVTATTQQIRKATNHFLGIEATSQAGQTAKPDAPVAPEAAPDQTPVTPAAPAKKAKPAPPPSDGPVDNDVGLTSTEYGEELAKSVRARVAKLPVLYPTVLETGSDFAQKPRVYKINGTGRGAPPRAQRAAYKWVFSRPGLGEYYGLMATRWRDPPLLNDPDETREIGDREYDIFYDGDRVRIVAWEDEQGSYWLSNTLIDSLSAREMIKIAQGMKELPRFGG